MVIIRNDLDNTFLGHEFSQEFFGFVSMNYVFISNYKLFSSEKLKEENVRIVLYPGPACLEESQAVSYLHSRLRVSALDLYLQ